MSPPVERPEPARARAVLEGPVGLGLVVVSLLGCLAGLVAGVRSGPLWLDEALSVTIARLPLLPSSGTSLYDGLRQDGAPPVYYLLLHGWTALFGTATAAVRVPSVLLTAVALLLVWRLGRRVAGGAGGRGAVIALASLPWTMRYGSETRMYLLVVVLSLLGALAVLAVHRTGSRRTVGGLAVVTATLLLTHYWALFLFGAVGLLHLPGLLRRRPASVRVVVGLVLGAVAFVPWAPTFLFQAAHTGAPWADPTALFELVRTPRYWGGGSDGVRTLFAWLLVPLAGWGATAGLRRPRGDRALAGLGAVASLTLLAAFVSVYLGGGAYTGRYTAVVVAFVALLVGVGAVRLPGRWTPVVALGVLVAFGLAAGIPAAGRSRSSAAGVVAAYDAAAGPQELLAYCPDQLGPPVARLLAVDVPQVVYPSLGAPQRIDWVDYAARQDAADPAAVAATISARGGERPLFLLSATEYRTFEGDCEGLRGALTGLRGAPQLLFGNAGTTGQLLYRYGPPLR